MNTNKKRQKPAKPFYIRSKGVFLNPYALFQHLSRFNTLYDEWPEHISECIDSIKKSENIEELENNETQNCLYYHCIVDQILHTDAIDGILNNADETARFNQIKIYLLRAMSDLEYYLSNRRDPFID